jgi:HlyD family secretion protein
MKSSTKELLTHPLILWAVAAVAVIAVGSGIYYFASTRQPATVALTTATTPTSVTGTGIVEAAQSGDLAFETGGRVESAPASVGEHVGQGQLLASLDTAALGAARDQASANVAAAQAQLSQMQAGPRQVDLAQKQTAVDQAQQTLANDYANVPNLLESSYSTAYDTVHTDTDSLFSNSDSSNPTLNFQSSDSQAVTNTENGRVQVGVEFTTWKDELASLGTDNTSLEAALSAGINHLSTVRSYGLALNEALTSAVPSTSFNASSIVSAQASASALQTGINTLITSLQSAQQKIDNDKLAVTSAQNDLAELQAGSTPQAIAAQQAAVAAAQAGLEQAEAALGNAEVISPFAGTVASVDVKVGQIVAPDAPAVSVTPDKGLQVSAYLSEIDAAKVSVGQAANVTLDAYGTGRVFPASVVGVDKAPSQAPDGTQGYKVTLQFTGDDSAISLGMTANVTIPLTN